MRRVADFIVEFFVGVDRVFARIVTILLILCLFVMIALVFYQVIMRNFFNTGLVWGEIAARNLVIWIAFLGASLATRSRQHISVDFLTKLLPHKPKELVRFLFDGLACVVTFFLASAAYKFVLEEKTMGRELIGNVPTWIIESIIPFGFALISFQYAIGMVLDIRRFLKDRGF